MMSELNRRKFLEKIALGAGVAAIASPLAHAAAGGGAPRSIIDTHTHFYDPTRPEGVPWPPKDDPLLYRKVLPKDYLSLPVPQKVEGTVVVEASAWVEDNQWILDLAKDNRFIVGLVGNLSAGTPEFAALLKRFTRDPVFRGIRIGYTRLKEGLQEERFMADMKRLADADMALDVLGGPEILAETETLAQKVPQLRIIIDHVANIRIDGQAPGNAWQEGMKRCAGHENVFCKVSGLVEGTGKTNGNAPADVDFYRPVLDHLWNVFGSRRLVYGSNWPVSERFAPLQSVQGIVARYFQEKGGSALDDYFFSNSQSVYKWIKRS